MYRLFSDAAYDFIGMRRRAYLDLLAGPAPPAAAPGSWKAAFGRLPAAELA